MIDSRIPPVTLMGAFRRQWTEPEPLCRQRYPGLILGLTMIDTSQRSPLLVFGVSGRIGSGCSFVRDWLRHSLATYGYGVEVIDVTRVFLEQMDGFLVDEEPQSADTLSQTASLSAPAGRVRRLQENGNRLRRRMGNDSIAALCVNEIIRTDIEKHGVLEKGIRKAYIIDSLKHPDEVRFLRKVFRDAFCMIGVVASDRVRMKRLRERKGFDDETFELLSSIDANEGNVEYGQKAIDAVTEADYFFANDYATKEEIQTEAERLMRLVFGIEIQSPRRDEVGMQAAYKAAKRSACLSRQVGAAIFDQGGQILALGHNDVPQFRGGLYGPESDQDERCYARGGKCYNDEEKGLIVGELLSVLRDAGVLKDDVDDEVIARILRQSRIKNLIEFTRAVHAETDAIINVARAAKPGLLQATLYCTTFPCHNCAKHIIDAGIARVVYLEPYEKSLARKLHADAINAPHEERRDDKVSFDLYGGVSPTRFDHYFGTKRERKKDGKFIDRDRGRAGLLPIGAQEIEVLRSRIEHVTAKIDAVVDRVKMEGKQRQTEFPAHLRLDAEKTSMAKPRDSKVDATLTEVANGEA